MLFVKDAFKEAEEKMAELLIMMNTFAMNHEDLQNEIAMDEVLSG